MIKLKNLAKEALKVPNWIKKFPKNAHFINGDGHKYYMCNNSQGYPLASAEFIIECSPKKILKLIELYEAVELWAIAPACPSCDENIEGVSCSCLEGIDRLDAVRKVVEASEK